MPEGATPKDGPSAGVAMVTAMVSIMTGIPVRKDVAMTGEITLRGRVLPIGGLKEKLLAALRGGITSVIIPEENAKDLAEIADSVKNQLSIIPVSRMEQVLEIALGQKLQAIVWDDADMIPQAGRTAWRAARSGHNCPLRVLRLRTSAAASSFFVALLRFSVLAAENIFFKCPNIWIR